MGCRNGFAICLVCASHSTATSSGSKFGRGLGSFSRKGYITQHTNSRQHVAALQTMTQRLRAPATQEPEGTVSVVAGPTPAASAEAVSEQPTAPSAVVPTIQRILGCRAVIAAHALLETSSSFRSIDVWLGALTPGDREVLGSTWHTRKLVSAMAQYEKIQTYRLLREGAVFRLAADGLERTYQVEIGTVIWSLPAF